MSGVIPYMDVDDDDLSDEQILEKYALEHYGPVWQRGEDGKFILPEFTLGWQIAAWCTEYLNPLGAGEEVFRFTMEQLRVVLWWYALNEDGSWVYPERGTIQRIKGWGKDPLLAVLCLVEAFGPCRFAGWDDGNPVAVRQPNALVQLFAVSQSQTLNTFDMLRILVSERLIQACDLKMGFESIRGFGMTSRLEQRTLSPRSAEGNRATFALLNETQHWTPQCRGQALRSTVQGNLSKMRGRFLAITNAYQPGENSVAQEERENYEASLEGRVREANVFYDTLEAPAHTPLTERVFKLVYNQVRGDSYWCSADSAWNSTLDPSRPTSQSRRMFLNQVWQEESRLYTASEWDQLYRAETLEAGDEIVLGFDGGKSDDATALVAIRVRDALVVPLLLEEKPPDLHEKWEVDRERVDSAVHRAFREYKVVGFFADVAQWESYIHEWTLDYGAQLVAKAGAKPIALDMRGSRKRIASLHMGLMDAIRNGKLHHGGPRELSRSLRRHVLNAVRVDTPYGTTFSKDSRESKRKVDMYAAMMLAHAAYVEYRETMAATGGEQGSGVYVY